MKYRCLALLPLLFLLSANAQTLQDDFENTSSINTWYADDAQMEVSFDNPFSNADNPSAKVLRYEDTGGLYANVGFDAPDGIRIGAETPFRLKIFCSIIRRSRQSTASAFAEASKCEPRPAVGYPSEIIKPLVLDEWQS
ncbi:MAG: hypothetical protein R2795_02205 [Saprospiraceae bacterium]